MIETIWGMFGFWDDTRVGSIDWNTYTIIPDAEKNLRHGGGWQISEQYAKTVNNTATIDGIWLADIAYLGDKPTTAKMYVYDKDGQHEFEAPSDWVMPYITGLQKPQRFTEVGSMRILNPTAFSDGERAKPLHDTKNEYDEDGWFGMTGESTEDLITGQVIDENWHGYVSTGVVEPSSPYKDFKPRGTDESWESYESQFDYQEVVARKYDYLAEFSIK